MPFFEILKAGKLIKSVEVPRDKAVAGCSIRVGTAGRAVLKLGESTRVGEYDVRLVEGPPGGGSGSPIPSGPVPRLDGYAIQHQLGEGGMGTVWKGIQLSTKRAVAIKFLSARAFESERAQRRFVREVELSAKLEHPNIARIYDSGLRHGAYYYAMELVEGVSLDKYIEENKADQARILTIMRTVCQAIEHAHQRGVVHRDLKPTNIMVDTKGQPRVVDFGLAKSLQVDDTEKQMTVSIEGNAAGTPAYMSPEQAIGRIEEIDSRSDIYSLGVILYRLVVGQPPIDLSGSRFEVMQRIVRNEIRPPRQFNKSINADLDGLLRKCLAAAPDDRYATAGELADDIENYQLGRPLRARKATAIYLLGKRLGRHRLAVAAAASGCLAVALIAVGLLPNGWVRQLLSETRVITVRQAPTEKIVMVPSTQPQPATEPVAHGKLEDAVPYQSQADVLWGQVKDMDHSQGLGDKLDAAAAVKLSAQTFFDKEVYDSAADNYKKFIKQCGDIQRLADARDKAATARESWQKFADVAEKTGIDTGDADVWTQIQSTAAQASDRFEAGDFAAALSSWETATNMVEKQRAKQSAAIASTQMALAPATQPEQPKAVEPFVTGKFGNALQFDGTTSYVDMNDPKDNRFELGPTATLETWVQFDALPAVGTFATFISKDEGNGHRNKWVFGYASDYQGLKNSMLLNLGFGAMSQPAEWLRSDNWIPDLDRWYHVAVTKIGDNYTFYRDGAVIGHASATYAAPKVNHSLSLGAAESGFRFCGSMDDLRFWNIARNPREIQADMNHELTGQEPGLMAYWQFNEAAGTTLHNLSRPDDFGIYYGTHGLASATQPAPQFDLNNGLVLHFSFGKPSVDGVVKDESGNNNNGQIIGAKWVAEGPMQGAYEFVAANRTDAIVVPDSASLNPQQITESAWVKTKTVDKWWHRIIDKSYHTAYDLAECGDQNRTDTSLRGKAVMDVGIGDDHRALSEQSIADGKWHHLVSTYDGTKARIYVDGKEQRIENAWNGRVSGNADPLRIGNGPPNSKLRDGTPNLLAFDGEIADVRIYNRPLSPDEIVALRDTGFGSAAAATTSAKQVDVNKGLILHFSCKASADDGVVKDESGNGNDGQVQGAKWVADGPGHGAYLFKGANKTDIILVADSPSLNYPEQITESVWIKTSTADKWWRRIIDKKYVDAYDLAIGGNLNNGSTAWRGRGVTNLGADDNHRVASDEPIVDGKWHHVASTYDGAQEKFYVDGKPQKLMQIWKGRVGGDSDPLRIGNGPIKKFPDGTPDIFAFDGEISDVRIYNRALSAEEIVTVRDAAYVSLDLAEAANKAAVDLLAAQADQPMRFENFDSDGTQYSWTRSGDIWTQLSLGTKNKRDFKIVERAIVANHKGTIIQASDARNSFVFIPDRNSGSLDVLSKNGDAPWLGLGTMQNVK